MNPLRIARLLPASLLALLPMAAAAGGVTPKPGAATFGTRDQLRECMALDDTLRDRSAALAAQVAATDKRVDENAAEDARLVDMKKTLDRNDKTAIANFNEAVMTHKQHIEQANHDADVVDQATRALDADKADADRQCGTLTYRPADVEAVGRERKKAAAQATAASAS